MGTPLRIRVQSPGHALLLTPNDDETERAQVRRARAAALRRKSGFGSNIGSAFSAAAAAAAEESNVLSREHILELHNNCIKLAAENVCNLTLGFLISFAVVLRFPMMFLGFLSDQ